MTKDKKDKKVLKKNAHLLVKNIMIQKEVRFPEELGA